jgi:hypothetical protein
MSVQCPVCSKVNPQDAYYCYYDGRPLSKERQQGPLHVGNMPFAAPFYFADGQGCANFNQLALACDNRWEEARGLLVEGIWPTFFGGIGRLDLAAAAKLAAREPDHDRGLSQLLEKLPADPDCLRPPKVSLESTEENLGQLAPGTDRSFELVVANQGMLLLHGTISTNCDWLVLGDRAGPSQKLFQTRDFFTIKVWVLGSKLRAGLVALQGEIAIDTNGGAFTLPVRADVPIVPFPKGKYANDSLAGARSPREVAVKAKQHPIEAATLFEQGAVKVWYAANGWTYPIEGTEGSGKGAVQQFFEALGLTKPPRLEIKADPLMLKCRVGEHLSKKITLRTEENKPVYAQAWSSQEWVKIGLIKYRGNMVTIPLEIDVPPQPGETVQAKITIQGNGKQRFFVPVTITVDKAGAGGSKAGMAALPAGGHGISTAGWWLRWFGYFAGGFALTSFLLVTAALVIKLATLVLR